MTFVAKRIAVIGGGWAGLTAALKLADAGHEVHLYEAARTLGGRARRVTVDSPIGAITLDNGQHILLGAYQACFRLFRRCNIEPKAAMQRLPLQIRYLDGTGLVAPTYLPAPLHTLLALLCAKGFTFQEKFSCAFLLVKTQLQGWRIAPENSVVQWWQGQPAKIIAQLWEPLCVSALNTPPEQASAQVFLNVLRDSLGNRRAASDMYIPNCDLSRLMVEQAAKVLQRLGAHIHMGERVIGMRPAENDAKSCWQLDIAQKNQQAHTLWDAVVIATAPQHVGALLAPLVDSHPILQRTTSALQQFAYAPIITIYFLFTYNTQGKASIKPRQAFYALHHSAQAPGQFVFNASHLLGNNKQNFELYAVVISAALACIDTPQTTLIAQVEEQLRDAWKDVAGFNSLGKPVWSKCIIEKQATLLSSPDLLRPSMQIQGEHSTLPPFVLAGDYVQTGAQAQYPATLEAAVQSGESSAQILLRQLNEQR